MMKANVLVREANFLAQEMAKDAEFSVTLQIPAANLSPNRKVSALWDSTSWWQLVISGNGCSDVEGSCCVNFTYNRMWYFG